MLNLKVELLDKLFPVSVGEVASLHQVVAPPDVFPVMEFDEPRNSFIHQHNSSIFFADPNITSRVPSHLLQGLMRIEHVL